MLSGNAARYPLVERLLREGLRVAGLGEAGGDRFTFDSDNLKHAVAKGAAMARLMGRVVRTAAVQYPPDLSERLPYEVGVHQMHDGEYLPIFKEFTRYEDLDQSRTVAMRSPTPGQAETLVLERRFPGDDKWSRFASYTFAGGLAGAAHVAYDDEQGRFVATSGGEPSTTYEDLTDPLEHVSLQNRGDL